MSKQQERLLAWQKECVRLDQQIGDLCRTVIERNDELKVQNERIAELESILRDIVADSDYSYQDGKPYPAVTWTTINRAKKEKAGGR